MTLSLISAINNPAGKENGNEVVVALFIQCSAPKSMFVSCYDCLEPSGLSRN